MARIDRFLMARDLILAVVLTVALIMFVAIAGSQWMKPDQSTAIDALPNLIDALPNPEELSPIELYWPFGSFSEHRNHKEALERATELSVPCHEEQFACTSACPEGDTDCWSPCFEEASECVMRAGEEAGFQPLGQ